MPTIDFDRFFCTDLFKILVEHFRGCEHCRRGAGELLTGFPVLTMFVPSEKKKELLTALDALGKPGAYPPA